VKQFMLEVFQKRKVLGLITKDIELIEELQAAIMSKQKVNVTRAAAHTNPLQAHVPVVDARITRGVGTQDWGGGANW